MLVLQTGVGADRTEAALNWLRSAPCLGKVPCKPKLVIAAGFAGALREGLAVGDIVVATEIVDDVGQTWQVPWPGELPPGEWRPPLQRGRVYSSRQLLPTPEDKRRAGLKNGALAVDMESAVVARLCRARDVPFGCVRVISDAVETALSPTLLQLLTRERVSLPRLAGAVLTRPRLAKELWHLAKDTGHAADHLGRALGELLTLTLPFGREL